jgi:hypothetical protein
MSAPTPNRRPAKRNRPVPRKPRPVSHYAGKCRTRTEIRERLRATSVWMKIPLSWLPEIARMNAGEVALGIVLCLASHSKGKHEKVVWGKIGTGEWTPDLLDRDIAAELAVSVEAVRDQMPDMIERGIIGRHPEHKHRYKLLPQNWPAITRDRKSREKAEKDQPTIKLPKADLEASEVDDTPDVSGQSDSEEPANSQGAATPRPEQLLLPGAEARVIAEVASMQKGPTGELVTRRYPLECRNRTSYPIKVSSSITVDHRIVLDLDPPSGSPTAKSASRELATRLERLGYRLDPKLANRLYNMLPEGCTAEVAAEVVLDRIARKGASELQQQMLPKFFREDLPTKWAAVAKRLAALRETEERTSRASEEKARALARNILAADVGDFDEADREWARSILG